MSASLLRKSLELVDSEFTCKISGAKNESRIKILKPKKQKDKRGAADVQRRNIASVEQAKKQLKKKRAKTLSNLEKLEKLKRPVIDEKLAKLILEYSKKPSDKDQEVIFLKEEPKSVFTEEDFARFAAEYVDED
ncbi:uncharacterized protein [Rhodnius prolixus]|uniref:Putative ribosomal protein n=1 Tax=Rhodnius neglectus TaxID=72488 RepID=A0A0N7Z9F7_9HEMI